MLPCRRTSSPVGRGHNAAPSACLFASVALFQGNFVTAIISSTFNSLNPVETLRFILQTCYLQHQDNIATFY
ncbi:hypothetical protein CI104_17695 [Citrobacter farmeri]|uniref:Uncharacterized protein n=1 Tax=Citrobacter farmeri TaxID=67824 RepID=A0ACA8D952_9ENTR|nr:hypothetical protein CI104_17695 [Citrobacter farmeri]RSB19696.1 hypothetical protein EGK65_08410 [Citrobacter farmeri]